MYKFYRYEARSKTVTHTSPLMLLLNKVLSGSDAQKEVKAAPILGILKRPSLLVNRCEFPIEFKPGI